MRRVGVREEQVQLARLQLAPNFRQLPFDLRGQLLVIVGELSQFDDVVSTSLEPLPAFDLLPVLGGIARQPAGLGRVVPDPGLG